MHRGSLQYWNSRRAQRRLPRLRSAARQSKGPSLGSIVAFKVAMGRAAMLDNSDSPSKNMEVSRACTLLEIPSMLVYGMRFYRRNKVTGYREVAAEIVDKASAERLGMKEAANDSSKLPEFKAKLGEFSDVTALIAASPKGMSVGQHHGQRFESSVGGQSVEERFAFISSQLGKSIDVSEFFKAGEHVDLASITKGKGWAGVIKRFGVARLPHKETQKIRHVGTLGPFTPGKVLFTVPHAGQMGSHYRMEHNKRILKIFSKDDAAGLNPRSGFQNYGVVRNACVLVDGSVPGPSKRLVRIRRAISGIDAKGPSEPKINNVYF